MSRVTKGARSHVKHALEAYNMKTTKSPSCSIRATFTGILLAAVLVTGRASTRDQIASPAEVQ
jgi:hypothetical protein